MVGAVSSAKDDVQFGFLEAHLLLQFVLLKYCDLIISCH